MQHWFVYYDKQQISSNGRYALVPSTNNEWILNVTYLR